MNVGLTDVAFMMNLDLPGSYEIATHIGILPNCHSCPYGKLPSNCDELCEPYAEELNKLVVGSVGFVQPGPVMDVISANNLRGVDSFLLLSCPSTLTVIENSMIVDDRFMSDMNRERVLDILQKEIETGGTILTKRQFEVLYLTYVDGMQPSEIAPLLHNNDDLYNLNNSYKAGNISKEEYEEKKIEIDNQPRKSVTSQTVLFHLRRATIKIAKASGLREEVEPAFKLQKIRCAYVNCGKLFTPVDKNQKFHSVQCRRKHKNRHKSKKKKAEKDLETSDTQELRICANPKCLVPFVPHDVVQKYCNIKCRKRHYNIKYLITKKKKIQDIFTPVSRTGEMSSYSSVSFLMTLF